MVSLPCPPRVVTDLPLSRDHQARIVDAFDGCSLGIVARQTDLLPALDQADIALLAPQIAPEALLARPHLRWVQIDSSGLERFARPELLDGPTLVTGSAGRSAPVLAEHALMFMLSHTYRLPFLLDAQRQRRWAPEAIEGRRGLFGQCVGIVGMGQTGQELARMCKMLNMRVLGYNRSRRDVAAVDTLYTGARDDGLPRLLEQADFVVLCLALTDETRDIIGAPELKAMKPTACLINLGRGELVQEPPLVVALNSGELAGAGLDVFRQEPLPPDSPLWTAPEVLITPHVTPGMPDRLGRTVEIFVDNLARYRNGAPLRNQLQGSARSGAGS